MNSGQYPVQMTRKPMQERGLKGVKNPKTPLGEPATGPSRSLRLRRSFRKSVSTYPRSAPGEIAEIPRKCVLICFLIIRGIRRRRVKRTWPRSRDFE